MFAVIYLASAFLFGWVLLQLLGIDAQTLFQKISGRTSTLIPAWTFVFPFSLIAGTTLLTTFHYYLSLLFSLALPKSINPLLLTNLCMIPLLGAFFYLSWRKVLSKKVLPHWRSYFTAADSFYWSTFWFFSLFSIFLIFYSFFVTKNILHSGYTVFGDFAPHTAIISSFAKGSNFPTQYPHFANDGIKYHFFFFYLCGNLEYLGMRMDLAMNIPSILGILSFTLLLGGLAVLLTKKKWTFFLAPFLLFFRSSYAVFSYLKELSSASGATWKSILKGVLETNKFIGETLHDDWGLWTVNVYANQRHFLWGFSLILIVLFFFLPTIQGSLNTRPAKKGPNSPVTKVPNSPIEMFPITSCVKESFFTRIVQYFTDRNLWKIKNPKTLILCSALIACLPYWHGSMMISLLCILFCMAFFSDNRFSYLITAAAGVLSAVLQARLFSGGAKSVASATFLWGFLAENKSLTGVLSYLFQVLGIAFIFLLILPFLQNRKQNKVFYFACLSPLVFAFCISLTPDVTVNHKYIIIAMGFLNIFIADAFCNIWAYVKESFVITRLPKRILMSAFSIFVAVFITFSLCASGVVELIAYVNKNVATVNVDLKSPLTSWIEENTAPDAVFLTAPYHMNAFFFSGRKVYYGWSYFTWSAGHDTASRLILVRKLFSGCGGNLEEFKALAQKEKISYVIIDDELLNNADYNVDVTFFETNFKKVLSLPGVHKTSIYKLYD